MNPAAIALAVLQYGPSILPVLGQIATWVKEGKKEVTPEDIQILIAFASKRSGDYLKDAGVSV